MRLDGVMQPDDEAIHAARQRGDFAGIPSSAIVAAASTLRSANSMESVFRRDSTQFIAHPTTSHARGIAIRTGAAAKKRRGLGNFLAHNFLLRDLDCALQVACRIDAPHFASGFGVRVPWPGLKGDVDGRKGTLDERALRIPDSDGELIFGILIRLRGRVCGRNAATGVERDLAQLTVEKLRRLVTRIEVSKCARRQTDSG